MIAWLVVRVHTVRCKVKGVFVFVLLLDRYLPVCDAVVSDVSDVTSSVRTTTARFILSCKAVLAAIELDHTKGGEQERNAEGLDIKRQQAGPWCVATRGPHLGLPANSASMQRCVAPRSRARIQTTPRPT